MRNPSLHAVLEAFTADAAERLAAETRDGAEIPFELVAEPGGSAPLYCYRPLTDRYIDERLSVLGGLLSYAPALRALAELDTLHRYLGLRGACSMADEPRVQAQDTLRIFLERVFAERSRFGFEPDRFDAAYAELELALYEGQRTTTVVAPLLGLALDHTTAELALGDGLSLVRGDRVPDVPREAAWGAGHEPNVLAMLSVTEDVGSTRSPVAEARGRFRRLLSALRLFERGGFALGPLGWTRVDGGAWRPVALSGHGRPRSVTFVVAAQEDELRAFHNLMSRRPAASAEVAWALGRFEMAGERLVLLEALSDYLLAGRALLEPEGPASGRLAGRLAALCAQPGERAALTERMARAAALEHAVIAGGATPPDAARLVEELAEHLRAVLRDVLCGHLDSDLCALADELLSESALAL